MAKSEYHKQYYLDNNLDSLIEKTSERMQMLKLMKEIREINRKLLILRACIGLGSAPVAIDEKPPAVHPAPIPDQET